MLRFLGVVVTSISATLAKGVRQGGGVMVEGGLVAKLMRQGGGVVVEGVLVGLEELLMLASLVVFTVVATLLPRGPMMNVGQGSMCELMVLVVNSWEVEV